MTAIRLLYIEIFSQAFFYQIHCLHGLIVSLRDQLARTHATIRAFLAYDRERFEKTLNEENR